MGIKPMKIAFFILLVSLPCAVMSQDQPSGLKVDSNPPGAEATIDGDITVTGLTPITFPPALNGRYRLEITKDGYETYKSSLLLQAGRGMNLSVSLTPKSRYKAALRSMIIPGWGQHYSGEDDKAILFALLAVGAAGAYLVIDDDFDDKIIEYNALAGQYSRARTFQEKDDLYPELKAARKKAYDAETARIISIGAVIGVWGLNLLDALLFFPENRSTTVMNDITLEPDLVNGGAKLVLTHNF
jgi:hypothetical protein